ncbi:MAG TPA: hypothetical protein VF503_27770 [Sphingobium sp.]|uniref:hypothetical protein n=1 Tax=Sphingobium sp. TaxID=1912891 RepID=UPI002ED08C24
MVRLVGRLLATLTLLLPLSSCYLAPGKFTSTLDIRKDRSFTFTYVGEVIAPPDSDFLSDKKADGDSGEDKPPQANGTSLLKIASPDDKAADKLAKPETAATRTKMEALAQTLSKEYGFRSVRYLGNAHFTVDYAISSKLTHAFIFPFNVDGEIIIPFIAIELRGADRVRMKAPGYAADEDKAGGMSGLGSPTGKSPSSELNGTFTLTTDAEIISQNQENGTTTLPDGRKRIVWTATPQTKDAPLASLKLDALP